ncbi:MAG: HPr-rel-A system PqqD family peptide chaperone [Halioglobus sp.]|nr:HPr-rel-A system PqqD family peptide chaperone [Halioglobus sp.]
MTGTLNRGLDRMSWRAAAQGEFYDAGEGVVVYYDPRSGDTHLIGQFAAFILQQLGKRDMTLAQIRELVAPLVEAGDDGELVDSISTVLGDLVDLDVLQRAEDADD